MPARVTSRASASVHGAETQQPHGATPDLTNVIDLRTRTSAPPADPQEGARGPGFESGLLVGSELLALTAVALVSVGVLGPGGLAVPLFAAVLLIVMPRATSTVAVSAVDDLPRMAGVAGLAAVLALAMGSGLESSALDPRDVVVQSLLLLASLVVAQTAAAAAVRRMRTERRLAHRTIVVGSGPETADVVERLERDPELGFHLVGVVRDRVDGAAVDQPWLGRIGELPRVVEEAGAHRLVVVGAGAAADPALLEAVRGCTCPDVWWASSTGGLAPAGSTDVGGMWLTRVRAARPHSAAMAVKRAVDIAITALALVFLWPVLATIAVALRVVDGPGVLFAQQRIGLGGRPFTLYKFRSVRDVPAEASEPTDSSGGDTDASADAGAVWSIDGDSRVTPLGALLRRTCLDELPQLWNVLRGDMSLVGPRPERPSFAEDFARTIPHYRWRHRVPVGLTGLAQVNGLRGDTSIHERARLDNLYIEDWSPRLELSILVRTVGAIARPANGVADKA